MRTSWFVAVLVSALLFAQGCDDSGPTAPDTGPVGVRASTAFQNLSLVRSLEREVRPGTILAGINGESGRDGRLLSHTVWRFVFRDGAGQNQAWVVTYDGGIFYAGSSEAPPRRVEDVEPFLAVDSPEIVRLALAAGGAEFLEGRTSTSIVLGYFADPVFTLPPSSGACLVTFEDRLTAEECQVVLDSETGALRSTFCR